MRKFYEVLVSAEVLSGNGLGGAETFYGKVQLDADDFNTSPYDAVRDAVMVAATRMEPER